jgi:threonine/homoserine/homoserine lactone efflux protein
MAHYVSFLVFATVLAIAPGPDTFMTLRSTVVGGRQRGLWTVLGIMIASLLQGLLAATGLGAVIQHAEPVFLAIRYAGVAYLLYLGFCALRAAYRGDVEGWSAGSGVRVDRLAAVRAGFLCNITNPKVLAFNLAVLPQFVGSHAGLGVLLVYAWTLSIVGLGVLMAVIAAADAAQRALRSRRVRRGVEGATGLVFLGFATALAADS